MTSYFRFASPEATACLISTILCESGFRSAPVVKFSLILKLIYLILTSEKYRACHNDMSDRGLFKGDRRVQLKVSGSPSTYSSTGSGRFVSPASYFGVPPDRGLELPVCSRCRKPAVETAGEPTTADRSDVVSSEVSRSMHRIHDASAETDPPRPGLSRFQMEARFSEIPDSFNCTRGRRQP
jgi:hypothetical protein